MKNINSQSNPLYGIDDLDWSQWQTAYGDATSVPFHLKRLVNMKSQKAKEDALFQISVNIYNQAGMHSVIPITLDYLIQILQANCLSNKLELALLTLILELCQLDQYREFLITGMPNTDAEIANTLFKLNTVEEQHTFHLAYKKICGIRSFLLDKFSTHKDPNFRFKCIYILMFIKSDRESTIQNLQAQYPLEKNTNVRLFLLWAIAFIGSHLPHHQQQSIFQWLQVHKPRAYRGVTAHMFTLAELYVGHFTPEIESQILHMVEENCEYSFSLDVFMYGYVDFVKIAIDLVSIRKNLSKEDLYQLFRKILVTTELSEDPILEEEKYSNPKMGYLYRALINLSFTEPVGNHDDWCDHSYQEQQNLASTLTDQQKDTLSLLCIYPVRQTYIYHTLKKLKLPSSYKEIALWLGWLPEFDYWKSSALFNKPQLQQFPELEPVIVHKGLISFVEKLFPLPTRLLESFQSILNWKSISSNPHIHFSAKLIKQYEHLWNWHNLSQNKAIKWDRHLLVQFPQKVVWEIISTRSDLAWNKNLIGDFRDSWDWSGLSLNIALPWSAELITEFSNYWNWEALSSNSALPWSSELLDQFSRFWDWEQLSANQSLPWSEEFFSRHARHLWKHKEALANNPAIPWTENRLKKFDAYYWANFLSKNNGLPWSQELIEKYSDIIIWHYFCQIENFLWTDDFIENHKHKLSFDILSANTSLLWSPELINRYKDKWNWLLLSRNLALPWSMELLYQFESHWDWPTLIYNQKIHWTEEIILLLANHIVSDCNNSASPYEPNFPWTLELIQNPSFTYLFDRDELSLYSRVIEPLLDEKKVGQLLQEYQLIINQQKQQRVQHYEKYGPKIGFDHPLRKILNLI